MLFCLFRPVQSGQNLVIFSVFNIFFTAKCLTSSDLKNITQVKTKCRTDLINSGIKAIQLYTHFISVTRQEIIVFKRTLTFRVCIFYEFIPF